MDGDLSVPEGWLVEKDGQGIESFLSPDGTSLASRRLNNSILNHKILIWCGERTTLYLVWGQYFKKRKYQNVTKDHISKLKCTFNWSPFFEIQIVFHICLPLWMGQCLQYENLASQAT